MCLENIRKPLHLKNVERPVPLHQEVLVEVHTCGVCRTDLHIIDGDLNQPKLPLILGHQIVGTIVEVGEGVSLHKVGERIGIPWLGGSCHVCPYCMADKENLCDHPIFTGYTRDGGFAEFVTAHEEYVLPISPSYDDLSAAPLLCAGLIGFRAFRALGNVQSVGFYGFGSSAHLLIQLAKALGKDIYVFTRPGDEETQAFARSLGAVWAGGSDQIPPVSLDACLIFAPVGALYPQALRAVKKGGAVISAGIHMSDIPTFPYQLLWEERSISSIANLTRKDGHDFMTLVDKIHLNVKVTEFPLEKANEALEAIRSGRIDGSCVLRVKNP